MFSICNTATFTLIMFMLQITMRKFIKNDILTLLLLTVMTKNHLNAVGVFSAALSLIMIMLQANFSPWPSVIDRIKTSYK